MARVKSTEEMVFDTCDKERTRNALGWSAKSTCIAYFLLMSIYCITSYV